MKLLRWAVLPVITAVLFLPTLQASSRPTEPDYPCYVRTQSGRVINLTAMCAGKPTTIDVADAPYAAEHLKPQKQAANGGQVAETAREVKDNGSGRWTLSGKVQNQTQQSISSLTVGLSIQAGAQQSTQYVRTHQSSLPPGGYADFEVDITAPDHRPDFRVASTQWTNEDGTAGYYP